MGKFYESREFRELEARWREKLADAGFKDIESGRGVLQAKDTRTLNFQNREALFEFFTWLEHYVTDHPEIPGRHKRILELYGEGARFLEIARELKLNERSVRRIVFQYKRLYIF